jgi:methylenetetrahydrofolate dehydrogenase (NADP+)/methenyltetrahydrofolate cyclohydrolase
MTAIIIDGKALAHSIQQEVAEQVQQLLTKGHQTPCLAVILIGHNPASQIYVRHKQAACKQVGITSKLFEFPEDIPEEAIFKLIQTLNNDHQVHGILVQLPLPQHIRTQNVIELISESKDVDGFHPQVLEQMKKGDAPLLPCTAFAIMQIFENIQTSLINKKAVVVGQSMIVGKPTAIALELAGCHVTRCDINTQNLAAEVKDADILVVAVGKPHLIPGEWIKPGAIIIDVGINRLPDGKIVGDVDFEGALKKASFITPVPGGVGPITVAALLQNTLKAATIIKN